MHNRLHIYLCVAVVAGMLASGTGYPARAIDYGSQRSQAAQNSSDVFNSFLSVAQSENRAVEPPALPDIKDYDQLMTKYREASNHDPLADLLKLFPVASRERLGEFQAMSDSQVAGLLADNPPEQRILALVLVRSPRIARAEAAWKATLNQYPQTLFLQDLLNRYQAFTAGLTLGVGEEYQNAMIQMSYPSPGMFSLRGRVVEIDAEIAYRDYLREATEAVADTRVLLAQVRNRDELIAITNASSGLLSTLGAVAEAQYVTGTRSFSDLVRLQTEESRRRVTTQTLTSERDGLLASLATSLNLPADTRFGTISWSDDKKPSLDQATLRAELPKSRQEILQAALEVEKMDVMIKMTRREAVPDPTLGLSYQQSTMPPAASTGMSEMGNAAPPADNSGMDMGMESGDTGAAPSGADTSTSSTGASSMNGPMIDYRRSSYGVDFTWAAEMVDRRAEMAKMVENMTAMASGMLQMQLNRYEQGLRSEGTYGGRIIGDAQAALDVARIGYAGNDIGFSDLVGAELALLDVRTELANTKLDRRIAFAEIERIIGNDSIESAH